MTVTIQNSALQHGVLPPVKLRARDGVHARELRRACSAAFSDSNSAGDGKTFLHLLVLKTASDGLELLNLLVDLVALAAHDLHPALPMSGARAWLN